MKTKILTFALLTSSLITFGQVEKNSKDRNRFGVKGGLNYSNIIYGGEDIDFKPKVGYSLGATFNAISGKKLTLPVELLFNNFNTSTEGTDIKLSSISSNFMVHYYTTKNFYIESGLLLGIYTKGEAKDKISGEVINLISSLDLTTVDISLGLGLGYEFTNRTFLNLRYSYGILNTFSLLDDNSHLSNLSLNVGYSF